MSQNEIKNLLILYRNEIERGIKPINTKIILYGSYARGDFRPDSDVDVMILLNTGEEEINQIETKICDITYEFNNDYGTDIMPIVQSEKNFEYWKKADMFYKNVEREGVLI